MKVVLAVLAAVALTGCYAETKGTDDKSAAKPEKLTPITGTAAGNLVEDMTQYTSIKQGRKAADKIRAISAQRQNDLDEVQGK